MQRFKLVPLKHFETMMKQKNNACTEDNATKLDGKRDGNERILRDVIEQDPAKMSRNCEISPSFQYVADVENGPFKGGQAGSREKVPLFLPDATALPEYSKASNLQKSYEDMTDILYSKDIPDEVKIKLYHIFRDKYENVRNPGGTADDSEDVNADADRSYALQRILSRLPDNKKDLGNAVGEILYNEQSIKWDKYGSFTMPKLMRNEIDLWKLLNILIYKNSGSKKEITEAHEIVRPIFNSLEPYVMNRKLIKMHEHVLNNDRRLSRYVAW